MRSVSNYVIAFINLNMCYMGFTLIYEYYNKCVLVVIFNNTSNLYVLDGHQNDTRSNMGF